MKWTQDEIRKRQTLQTALERIFHQTPAGDQIHILARDALVEIGELNWINPTTLAELKPVKNYSTGIMFD